MEFLGTFAHFVTSIMQTFQGDIFKENCEHFWINTIFLVWMSITLHHDPQLIHIFSEGYRRYLALCLTSSVSHLVSAFLLFQFSCDVMSILYRCPLTSPGWQDIFTLIVSLQSAAHWRIMSRAYSTLKSWFSDIKETERTWVIFWGPQPFQTEVFLWPCSWWWWWAALWW